jgi:hypothetical protein
MNKLKTLVVACALGAAMLTGATARADIQWSYDFTPSSSSVISDSGNNSITFTNQAKLPAAGSSDVVATNLFVKTPVTGSSDTFTHQNYSLNMVLIDTASGKSTTLLISGDLTGTITPNSSNIVNEFDASHTSYSFDLGNNHYTVNAGSYTPVPPAGSTTGGAISVHVDATANNGQSPPPNDVPEPSTIVLSFLGLAGAGLGAWKKRARA